MVWWLFPIYGCPLCLYPLIDTIEEGSDGDRTERDGDR